MGKKVLAIGTPEIQGVIIASGLCTCPLAELLFDIFEKYSSNDS
jgi:hypothetical protein